MNNLKPQLIKLAQFTVLVLLISASLVLHWHVRRDDDKKPIRVIEMRTKIRRMR